MIQGVRCLAIGLVAWGEEWGGAGGGGPRVSDTAWCGILRTMSVQNKRREGKCHFHPDSPCIIPISFFRGLRFI